MIVWVSFFILIAIFLAVDLGIFNREAHEITYKEATKWTIGWSTLGILFSGVIYLIYQNGWMHAPSESTTPTQSAVEYLTGYIIELTLSIDNIFVIAMIFKSFKIPKKYQHRVLFWGIVGALVFRGLMIGFGVILIEKFTWTTYIFGAFLIYTAIKMAFSDDDHEFDPKKSFVYKGVRKLMPVTARLDDQKFFIRRSGLVIATPLFLALILVEFTDILFALDSIPAILGITTDPFIVFTSNIFAILGLRSMYFFVANMLDSFHYLKYSLTVILTYVGVKLILANHFHLSIGLSLGIIVVSVLVGILFSIKYKKEHEHPGS
jgi:tellurite resistance protein TerC